jgi:iron-sulfur cluster repair protein YtfE (RIC family)
MSPDGEKLAGHFKKEHEELLAGLQALQVKSPGARERFRELDRRIERQIRWEDNVLFKAIAGKFASCPVHAMRREHQRLRSLTRGALASLAQGNPEAARAYIRELQETLASHSLREESLLFPACDELLSDDEKKRVLALMGEL